MPSDAAEPTCLRYRAGVDHTGGRARRTSRWPYVSSQKILLLAAIAILAGTSLPWAIILGKALWGTPLAVSWTLWGGIMVLASAAVPSRKIVIASALIGGAVAVYFGIWQATRIVSKCFSFECLPGPGLGLLLTGGVVALYQTVRMFRDRAAA